MPCQLTNINKRMVVASQIQQQQFIAFVQVSGQASANIEG
jgi:hypothetical protein